VSSNVATFQLPETVAVLGLGASGLAAAALACAMGASVVACDEGDPARLGSALARLEEIGAELCVGDDAGARCPAERCGLLVLSPGVPPESSLLAAFKTAGVPVMGEIEFGFRFCTVPLIGITGTNGKTTTTELTAEILQGAGLRAMAAGNIGLPFSQVVLERGDDLDVIVLELSSFQLECIESFCPQVTAWLNFAPDHLDRYTDLEEYRAAKLRIFEFQGPEHGAVVRAGENLGGVLPDRVVTFDATPGAVADFTLVGRSILFEGREVASLADTRLRGRHNAENAMAAMGMARLFGLEFPEMAAGLQSYSPPPHRAEPIRTIGGVEWVNDSKATNLHALETALRAWDLPIILIAGGKQKGLDYAPLTELIGEKVHALFTIGEIGPALVDLFADRVPSARFCASLGEAVQASASAACPGDLVLFSPGTSSFDMFSGYVERGEAFRQLVNKL